MDGLIRAWEENSTFCYRVLQMEYPCSVIFWVFCVCVCVCVCLPNNWKYECQDFRYPLRVFPRSLKWIIKKNKADGELLNGLPWFGKIPNEGLDFVPWKPRLPKDLYIWSAEGDDVFLSLCVYCRWIKYCLLNHCPHCSILLHIWLFQVSVICVVLKATWDLIKPT